jgi:hypothetical protein
MGYGLDIGFIDHLYTPLGTTGKYSATTNLLQPAIFSTAVFW